MWQVSQRFLDTLTRSHRRRVYVDVLVDGQLAVTLDSTLVPDPFTGSLVQSVGGSIHVDKSEVQRSGTIDLVDIAGAVDPRDVAELFTPTRSEVRVWIGLDYWDATPLDVPEYCPVGTLVVTGVTNSYPAVRISGYDRMWLVGPFINAYKVSANTVHSEAIKAILALQMPASRLDTSGIITTEHTTGLLAYNEQDNAQTAVADIAEATGQVLYVDPLGVFTTEPQSSTDDQPVVSFTPGSASIMMRPTPSLDASQSYNVVVFTGETADGTPPVRGYAQDNNPLSITYVPKVGARPLFASSPLIRTTAQAQLAAQTRLLGILGVPDTTAVPTVPNPALTSGDVAYLADPDQGIDKNVIIDSFSLGLRASDGAQELTCRSNVVAL